MSRLWPLGLCALLWLASGTVVVGTPTGRAAVRALLLLPDLFQDMPLQPSLWLRPPPVREHLSYTYQGRVAGADLYRPAGAGPFPGLVFTLGVSPAGTDDPRVVRFGEGLARAGFVLLIIDSPDLRQDRVVPEEIDGLVTAFQMLRNRPEVDPRRTGLMGVSAGGGLALIAAADPRIAHDLAFVNVLGAYSDARTLITAVTTERITVDGQPVPWTPDPLTVRIVRKVLIDALASPSERERIWDLLAQDLADADNLVATSLSPTGRAVYEVLRNDDPDRAAMLLQALPQELQARLRYLSPSTHVNGLRAPLYVMHDRGDPLIPFTESRQLVKLAAPMQPWYSEFDIFQHVDLKGSTARQALLRDSTKLFVHVLRIFSALEQ